MCELKNNMFSQNDVELYAYKKLFLNDKNHNSPISKLKPKYFQKGFFKILFYHKIKQIEKTKFF